MTLMTTTGLFNSSIMRFNNQYHSKLIWDEYMKRRSEFVKDDSW